MLTRLFGKKMNDFWACVRWVLGKAWSAGPGLFSVIFVCQVLVSALPAALAWVVRGIINSIVEGAQNAELGIEVVVPWLLAACGLALGSEIFELVYQLANRALGDRIRLGMARDHLNQASSLDLAFFEDRDFQDVIARASRSLDSQVIDFYNSVLDIFSGNLKIIGLISILFVIDPVIPLAVIPIFLPFMWFRWTQSKMRYTCEYTRSTKRRWSTYFISLLTGRSSMPEVKVANLAPILISRYMELFNEFINEDKRILVRGFVGKFIFFGIFSFCFYALFYRVSSGVIAGTLTIGDASMFAGAAKLLFDLLGRLSTRVSSVMERSLYIGDVIDYFGAEPVISRSGRRELTSSEGTVEFKNVVFSYPGSEQKVLDGISFSVRKGEVVALVGANGAGKTTIAKLITHLYDIDSGSIEIDGNDLREISEESLHRKIAYLGQDVNRYEATVLENMLFGSGEDLESRRHDLEDIPSSLIENLMASMPDAENTMLGRQFGKIDLSGGQWRKIGLSRVVLKKTASVIVLDEPTAGLDAKSMGVFKEVVLELAKNRSVIVISHQQEAIDIADRILEVSAGRCHEVGESVHFKKKYSIQN